MTEQTSLLDLIDPAALASARDEAAALRKRVAEMERELKWLRRRAVMPNCERCPKGGMWGGWPTGHYEKHGFTLNVCPYCWRPGDTFDLGHGATITIETDFRCTLTGPGGETTITCTPERHMDGQPWSMEWVATGEVEASGPGGGVMCRTTAVQYVLSHMARFRR